MASKLLSWLSALDDGVECAVRRAGRAPWLLLPLAVLAVWLWLPATAGQHAAPPDLRPFLQERPWFDQFPSDPRKTYQIYFFGKNGTGAYVIHEGFKQVVEIFFYKTVGERLLYWFPHSKLKGATTFKLADSKGPGTFDLSLEVAQDPKGDGKTRMFFASRQYKPRDVGEWVGPLCEVPSQDWPAE